MAKDAAQLLQKPTTLERYRAGHDKEINRLTYEQLVAQLTNENALADMSLLGDGFQKPGDMKLAKAKLVNVPFVITDWRRSPGDYGPFYSLRVVTSLNERLIINDGSTGIAQQMYAIDNAGYSGAINCKHGLTKSDYPVVDRDDERHCEACDGLRMIDPAYDEPVPGNKVCDRCEGAGLELMRDANGNVMRGTTFYISTDD